MSYVAVNGLSMYYEAHGEGPPLLLLHGGSGSIPDKWIPLFTPYYHVVAPEQMGHGRTGRIEAPTLVVIGDRDIVTPEHAAQMFRAIPRAQLCVVPDAGHGVMPAETVLTFLEEEAA
jgi:pimeloyl-ACP methyl ester carboxylesterase